MSSESFFEYECRFDSDDLSSRLSSPNRTEDGRDRVPSGGCGDALDWSRATSLVAVSKSSNYGVSIFDEEGTYFFMTFTYIFCSPALVREHERVHDGLDALGFFLFFQE